MPPLTTPLGYRYPTNITMDQVRTFGSPRGEGASGGYTFTPNVGEANGTSTGGRAQGATGGSAHVDQQVYARDSAVSGGRAQGATGGSAYMDQMVASRDAARAGASGGTFVTPDGVSTHFAHLWSARQQAEAEAFRANAIASFQAAIAAHQAQENDIARSRQAIVKTSVDAFVAVNPGFLPQGKLEVRKTPGAFVSDADSRLPGFGSPMLNEYYQPVVHPDLLGGSGALFGTRDELKGIPNAPTRVFRTVLVEKPFLDAMRNPVSFVNDSDRQVYTDGRGGEAMKFGQPHAEAVVLKDGRAAQQFGSANGPFMVLSARGTERWDKATLVARGLLEADGSAPPLRPVVAVNAQSVKAALDAAAAPPAPAAQASSPGNLLLQQKLLANGG